MKPWLCAALMAGIVSTASGADFAEGATPPDAKELDALIRDKVFTSTQADGSSWRLDYRSNGYFYVNTSGGFRASGKWKAEDGKLCSNVKTDPTECNEVRVQNGRLFLKRTNGAIIELLPA